MKSQQHHGVTWFRSAATLSVGLCLAGCNPAHWTAEGGDAAKTPIAAAYLDRPSRRAAEDVSTAAPGGARTSEDAIDGDARHRSLMIFGYATAGAGAVAGVTFAILSRARTLDADDKATALSVAGGSSACSTAERAGDCVALRRLRLDAAMFQSAALWSLLGSGVLEISMGVYGLRARRATQDTSLRVQPAISAEGAAISVTRAF
jgi:hypothetical protein